MAGKQIRTSKGAQDQQNHEVKGHSRGREYLPHALCKSTHKQATHRKSTCAHKQATCCKNDHGALEKLASVNSCGSALSFCQQKVSRREKLRIRVRANNRTCSSHLHTPRLVFARTHSTCFFLPGYTRNLTMVLGFPGSTNAP